MALGNKDHSSKAQQWCFNKTYKKGIPFDSKSGLATGPRDAFRLDESFSDVDEIPTFVYLRSRVCKGAPTDFRSTIGEFFRVPPIGGRGTWVCSRALQRTNAINVDPVRHDPLGVALHDSNMRTRIITTTRQRLQIHVKSRRMWE